MSHSADLAQALADRYELAEPLGAGGMASARVGDADRSVEWMRRSSLVRGWIDYPFWSERDSLVSPIAPHPGYQSVLREIEVRWRAALAIALE